MCRLTPPSASSSARSMNDGTRGIVRGASSDICGREDIEEMNFETSSHLMSCGLLHVSRLVTRHDLYAGE
jgi:hypothetical protein